MIEKKLKIEKIMGMLEQTYKPGSGVYKTVYNLLDKKASMDELNSLWLMVFTSTVEV